MYDYDEEPGSLFDDRKCFEIEDEESALPHDIDPELSCTNVDELVIEE